MIHYAALENSPRLQRVRDFLVSRGSLGATTHEIIVLANVCAVNTAISELRANGLKIDCEYERETETRSRVHRYTLKERP